MTRIKNIRLGLVHVAVTMTFVPINGILNRVMIHEKGILASIVALLLIFPYLMSPLQVWIGQFSDHHPIYGYRRTPYILGGILLCLTGLVLTPHTALLMAHDFWPGIALSIVAFGAWGFGNNLAAVSYLSLASDMSEEHERSRVISFMWVLMLIGIIATAMLSGRALEPYSDAQLVRVFSIVALVSLTLAAIGLIGLEPRHTPAIQHSSDQRVSHRTALATVFGNPQARRFFIYLILLLSALLGQDVLMEPFGAHAFGMTVEQTTRITALWGTSTMIALLLYGLVLNTWLSNRQGAVIGGVLAAGGLLVVALSGLAVLYTGQSAQHDASGIRPVFLAGIALLGFGTGIATSTNLALMLSMTTPEQTGLFIGAWGVADALSRGVGNLMGGVVRDVITHTTHSTLGGYSSVFLIEAGMLFVSLLLLRTIHIQQFREQQHTLTDVIALAGDMG